jgi:threonine dehydrogenase-like Zn-dependent dehydrogenase
MLAKALGAQKIIGTDIVPERLELARELKLCNEVLISGPDNVSQVRALTDGNGVEKAIDCSANDKARLTCIQATRKWGKICFLGEGGTVSFQPSPDISTIKRPFTVRGSRNLAHGRAGRTHRPLEHPSRDPDHPSLYPRKGR